MPKGVYPHKKGQHSTERIEQMRQLGKSRFKHGKPKCIDCGKQLLTYDATFCKSCARKGVRNKLYKKSMPIETREKIKNKLKLIYSDSSITPNWKGGITPLRKSIRTLPESTEWRISVFIRDKKTCRECGIKTQSIEAHHVKPFNEILQEFLNQYNQFSPIEDKEILVRLALKYPAFWDIENGLTLCNDCHKLTYSGEQATKVVKV